MQKRNAQEAAEIEYEKKRKRIAAGNNDDLESEDARTRRKNQTPNHFTIGNYVNKWNDFASTGVAINNV